MQEKKLSFKEAMTTPGAFSVTWELVPGRGAFEQQQEGVLRMAELAAKNERITGVSITDNPGGRPAITPSVLGIEVKKLGIDPLLHFTCKDRNRNGMESDLYALERLGLQNLMVMSGDYPTEGFTGRPKPVFDVDPVQALRLIQSLNKGVEMPSPKGITTLKPTNFFAGAVVSPFKKSEAEQMSQYYKLQKKVESGAKFIVTQLGYDVRKFDELRRFADSNNIKVPLIGNIFVLSNTIAKMMNENKLPGCVVTDELLRVMEQEKTVYGTKKEPHLLRAAKLYAILKGLKFNGIYIGGHGMKFEELEFVIGKGEELSPNWQEIVQEFQFPMKQGFYYFKKDDKTMLNTDEPVDRSKTGVKHVSFSYHVFKLLHSTFFAQKAPLYKCFKALSRKADGTAFEKAMTAFEYAIKVHSNGCKKCGDCAMQELGYYCPMAKCPKSQRNCACGGSFNEWCEVYPNKRKCAYVIVYNRLKASQNESKLKDLYIAPCNWDLHETSGWANYFLGRDFQGREE